MVTYRKTRIVCVSDTHGYSPMQAGFRLPPGDVLIHAGDLTNQGRKSELQRTMQWIQDADYEAKVVVAGNHDVTLDAQFYAEHGSHFHGQKPESPSECIELVKTQFPSVIFLEHSSALVKLTAPGGPRTMFKVFGSPYSRFQGSWAFGYSSADEGDGLWGQIPLDVDIVLTHSPPAGHCDGRHGSKDDTKAFGCDQLLHALERVRPMLAVCGHVHAGRGYERVRWDANEDEKVASIPVNMDSLPPLGSKKQSLVDLTGRMHRRLENTSYTNISICGDPTITGSHPVQTARKETCIVNAAIMATSWPYKGGKQFHSPIVVDLNLPVGDDVDGNSEQTREKREHELMTY